MSDDLTPTRRSTDQQHTGRLIAWLKLNVLTSILVLISIGGVTWAAGSLVASVSAWVVRNENTISANALEGVRSTADIVRLKADVVDIDRRLNEERERLTALHVASEAADAKLQAQFDTLAALAKLTSDRSFQPLAPPYQPPRGQSR
jgi:hypothetical protein